MAEGPDGKIYVGGEFTNAGGVPEADYLARWNPVSGAWEAVVPGISAALDSVVSALAFDAAGNLYVGGTFFNLGSPNGDCIVKLTNLNVYPATIVPLGTGIGIGSHVFSIVINSNGDVFVGGRFDSAGGVGYTKSIARWNGTSWNALVSGAFAVNDEVSSLAISPAGYLCIGGYFTDADHPYLCVWNGTQTLAVGDPSDLNGPVYALAFGPAGNLLVGGSFTNAGGNPNADYIASYYNSWTSLGTGTDGYVSNIVVDQKLSTYVPTFYVSGYFTSAGGLQFADRTALWANGAWFPLDINLPGTTAAHCVLRASDGSLYIGGAFSTAGSSENAVTGLVALNLNVTSASANTYPFMQIHGPGTLKAITNYSTGKTIAFDGLTLNAGEWINLFFDPLNLIFQGGWSGRGNLMRYVVPGSDYGDFYLKPGNNLISLFFPDSDENLGSGAFISWTPLFWGLDGALL